jgi:hypothetical protein
VSVGSLLAAIAFATVNGRRPVERVRRYPVMGNFVNLRRTLSRSLDHPTNRYLPPAYAILGSLAVVISITRNEWVEKPVWPRL